uniref:ATP synthase F1 complex delta/epsilon subunit N-terminal domain-containing protein n=1 Tax=Micromonas pusilla TaxID=38833 RepID=A0A7S0PM86_MICPS|mmetsp:Transcript_7424/g.30070  ORF Transcript_7424/g.30070 Transcript_7424/m.30070 type:complete len:215 (+) Transcript_7424:73-717(+)
MALRQAARRLGALAGSSPQVTRAFAVGSQRATMSTEAQRESVKDFLEKFKQHAPSTMDPPNFPSDFLPPAREVPATPPAKLTLNFYMPHEIEYEGAEVDSIQLPAVTGDMGVLPGHVPTVAQLRPGVVAVNMDDKETKKYFVSSGFAFVHANSVTDVMAVEAVPVEQLDGEAVKKALADYQAKLVNAKDDYEKAAAQIGIEVTQAMDSAVTGKA